MVGTKYGDRPAFIPIPDIEAGQDDERTYNDGYGALPPWAPGSQLCTLRGEVSVTWRSLLAASGQISGGRRHRNHLN